MLWVENMEIKTSMILLFLWPSIVTHLSWGHTLANFTSKLQLEPKSKVISLFNSPLPTIQNVIVSEQQSLGLRAWFPSQRGPAPFPVGGVLCAFRRPELEREEWSAWNTGSDRIGLVPLHPPLWFWFLAL